MGFQISIIYGLQVACRGWTGIETGMAMERWTYSGWHDEQPRDSEGLPEPERLRSSSELSPGQWRDSVECCEVDERSGVYRSMLPSRCLTDGAGRQPQSLWSRDEILQRA